MFRKISKTDMFYLVSFALTIGFLSVSIIITGSGY